MLLRHRRVLMVSFLTGLGAYLVLTLLLWVPVARSWIGRPLVFVLALIALPALLALYAATALLYYPLKA